MASIDTSKINTVNTERYRGTLRIKGNDNRLNIKHNDIHIDNILVDILQKSNNLYFVFENIKYILPRQTTVLYLIDFGIAEITDEVNPDIFKEWRFFFEKLEELFQIPPLFSKCSSFHEIFQYILQFKILKPDYSNILS